MNKHLLNVKIVLTLLTLVRCPIKKRPIGGEVPSFFSGFVIVSNTLNAISSWPVVTNLKIQLIAS